MATIWKIQSATIFQSVFINTKELFMGKITRKCYF